jgi:ADP-ribose pyrophosphatase YjhB (NUDIX family)
MCRRSDQPAQGQWMIPSGYLECGETLEEGAARETFEETGVSINSSTLELCSVLNMPDIQQVAIVFRTEFETKPKIRAGIECLDVAFMSEEDLQTVELAWREALGDEPRQLFSELRSGQFSIRLIQIASQSGRGFQSRQYNISSVLRTSQTHMARS